MKKKTLVQCVFVISVAISIVSTLFVYNHHKKAEERVDKLRAT